MPATIKLGKTDIDILGDAFSMLSEMLEPKETKVKEIVYGIGDRDDVLYANPIYKKAHEHKGRYSLRWGGRGSGKTIDLVMQNVNKCLKSKRKIAVFRKTFESIGKSIYLEYVRHCEAHYPDAFKATKRPLEINFENGSVIVFVGLDNAEKQVKGLQGLTDIHVEEAFEISQEDFELLDNTLRGIDKVLPDSQVCFTFNPENKNSWLKHFWFDNVQPYYKEEMYEINTTFRDNIFLDEKTIKRFETTTTKRSTVDRDGDWGGDVEGAAFSQELIEQQTIAKGEDLGLEQIVYYCISLDPAVGYGKNSKGMPTSDGHGLVVGGVYKTGHKVLLEDHSSNCTVGQIVDKVIALNNKYMKKGSKGVLTVIEANNGGDWLPLLVNKTHLAKLNEYEAQQGYLKTEEGIEKLNAYYDDDHYLEEIHVLDPIYPISVIPYKVQATKIDRARVLAESYVGGTVWHAEVFLMMQLQMTTFTGKSSDKSPNNLDAWGACVVHLDKMWNQWRRIVPSTPPNIQVRNL